MRLKVISGDGIAVEIPCPAEDNSAILERAEQLYRSGNEQECRRILISFAAPLFPEQFRGRVGKITTADAFKLLAALLPEQGSGIRTAGQVRHRPEQGSGIRTAGQVRHRPEQKKSSAGKVEISGAEKTEFPAAGTEKEGNPSSQNVILSRSSRHRSREEEPLFHTVIPDSEDYREAEPFLHTAVPAAEDDREGNEPYIERQSRKSIWSTNIIDRIRNTFFRKKIPRGRNCEYRMRDVEDILPVAYAFKWSLEYTLSLPEEVLEKCRSFTGVVPHKKDEVLPALPEKDINAAVDRALKKLDSFRKSTPS